MAIFIIDFDQTIVDAHTHNIIAFFYKPKIGTPVSWTIAEKNAQWNLIKHLPPIFSTQFSWKEIMEIMLSDNHQVAIASFSCYPHIIPLYLEQVLNLALKDVNQIFIEAWLPHNPATANKNQHITNVLTHFNFRGDKNAVFLIDDSKINTEAAARENYSIIPAHDLHGRQIKKGQHLDEIFLKLKNLKH